MGGVGLGRCNADFRPGIDVDSAVGVARDTRSHDVRNSNAQRSTLQAIFQGKQSIRGLTGLAHKHAHVIAEDRAASVQKVAGQFRGNGNLRQLLKDGACGYAAMVACSAGNEDEATTPANRGKIGAQAAQLHIAGFKVHTATHGVEDAVGLLKNLLLHKVREIALHDFRELQLERLNGADRRDAVLALQLVDVQLTSCNVRHVVVLKIQHALRVLHDGSGVAGEKVFYRLRLAVFSALRQE